MKKILLLFFVLAAVSCNKTDRGTDVDAEMNPQLKGVWKVTGCRMAGVNLMSYCPVSYLILDPEVEKGVMMTGNPEYEDESPICQGMDLKGNGEHFYLDETEFRYSLFEEGNTLELYPAEVCFIGDLAEQELGSHEMHIILQRDIEIESADTKGFFSWIGEQVVKVAKYVYKKVVTNIVDPYVSTVDYEPWSNTNGWKPANWMSNLPKDMPVCCVNLPGTHDSATASLDFVGVSVSADCQSLSIEDQYLKGARYFDLRVGNEFVWEEPLVSKRLPNQAEIDATRDLKLYHGPFCSDEKYGETLAMLARYVKDGETEFVFVNSQWEDMSYGVLDLAALYLDDLIDKTKLQDYFTSHLRHITLDIMNRIQRELNARYDGDLFINYTSDLTVEKARGHIILMESSHDSNCSKKNPQCNYLFGWPDKDCHYAKICAFDKKDAISRNLYVQSHYEMCLSDDDSISLKKTDVRKVASEVAKRNYNGEGILGFNAMNANTGNGYDLDVYEFAHIFNGDAFNMYVENMKNATKGKDRYYGGIVSMDHLGVHRYVSLYRTGLPVDVYGDYLTWAVIESNFYVKK